jgi:exodeoxyribonuclease VII small subunit
MPEKSEEPSFEEAAERLEALIEAMESGETPLAELVEKFEEGTRLLRVCREQLRQAELKIEKLNVETDAAEPFEAGDEAD